MQPLDPRLLLAVTATLADGTLFVTGDDQENVITISRDAEGTIFVNDGAVPVAGGPATLANTSQLHLIGAGADDILALDETNGPLPGAALFGGADNDILAGGSGIDFADGGAGDDSVFLGGNDDTFQWNPGDGSDAVEGQAGSDALLFYATGLHENIDLSASRLRARLTDGEVTLDLNGLEQVYVNPSGGADKITVNDLTGTGVTDVNVNLTAPPGGVTGDSQADSVIVNGTDGNDNVDITGSFFDTNGINLSGLSAQVNIINADGGFDALVLNTLGGNDRVNAADLAATNANQMIRLTENGGAGNDILIGSQGSDTVVWNPGDGSDTVESGNHHDTMILNGSDASEEFNISANGDRVLLTRDVGGVALDLGGLETIAVNPFGGADTITVNDLTGTALARIDANLTAALGGTVGDGQADSVIFNGTNAADSIPVGGNSGLIVVGDVGTLPYFLVIRAVEAADALRIYGHGGNDTIDASALATATFTVDGGAGDDTVRGSAAADLLFAGNGRDEIDGNGGDDDLTVIAGVAALASTQTLASLTIAAGGVLDLRDHSLILDYGVGDATPLGEWTGTSYSGVTGLIASGAITSSDTDDATGIAVAEAADVAPEGTFAGRSVDATAVLVKYTYAGDANLDGRIDADDYFRIDSGFLGQRTNPAYARGDFNYDGRIDADDYFLIDSTFLGQGSPLASATPLAGTQIKTSAAPRVTTGPRQRLRKRAIRPIFSDEPLSASRSIQHSTIARRR